MVTDKEDCGACRAAEILGHKWIPIIVCHLLDEPKRYNDLKRSIPGISPKVLTENLSYMERDEIIVREVRTQKPIAVRYRLTKKGQDLAAVIQALNSWGQKWLKPISQNHREAHHLLTGTKPRPIEPP